LAGIPTLFNWWNNKIGTSQLVVTGRALLVKDRLSRCYVNWTKDGLPANSSTNNDDPIVLEATVGTMI